MGFGVELLARQLENRQANQGSQAQILSLRRCLKLGFEIAVEPDGKLSMIVPRDVRLRKVEITQGIDDYGGIGLSILFLL